MIRGSIRRLAHSEGANVAPTVALSLFALIAAGGIAFDYARLASLDTELQNAADQAALAAASQLDGEAGACARAAAAASNVAGATDNLLRNDTRFANERATTSTAVRVQNEAACDATGFIQFYQSYDQENDEFGPAATTDAEAKVVLVRVDPREAFYALTPVVGAFRSGPINAEAVAALGSAMCKVPPVMMCNPAEQDGNTDPNLDFNPARGEGLRLVIDRPDAPGNFGFLRIDDAGAKEVAMQLGYDNPPHGCISTTAGIETAPGDMQAVRAAFNTRFDITENGEFSCPEGGICSSSPNARKDLVRAVGDECTLHTSKGWRVSPNPYRPDDPDNPLPDNGSEDPDVMGYPRDMCHAVSVSGVCDPFFHGIVGDGDWDIDAYFRVNYDMTRSEWVAAVDDEDGDALVTDPLNAAQVASVSRYDVYLWELRNPTTTIDVQQTIDGTDLISFGDPVCRSSPASTVSDRRRISVAVVNCEALDVGGHKKEVQVRKWLDVFLVEPAIARDGRTTNGDIYVEVIDVTSSGSTSTTNMSLRRDVPYLIR